MGRRKGDVNIGKRAYVEVHNILPDKTYPEIAQIIGCRRQALHMWSKGEIPSGIFLQRMCEMGADIDWILTGRRKDT